MNSKVVARQLAKRKQELMLDDGAMFQDEEGFLNKAQNRKFKKYHTAFSGYLEGQGLTPRYHWAILQSMHAWHNERSCIISLVEDRQETEHLAQGAHYGYWWLMLGPKVTASRVDGGPDVSIEEVTLVLADLLMLGHFEEAASATNITAPKLATPYMCGGFDRYPHAWFLLILCCSWQGCDVDTGDYDYDTPPDMLVYKEVLANWDTQDTDKVQALVTKMATYHMAASKENMGKYEINDFSSSEFWLYPYEILAWLKLRTHLGLPNPVSYEHPLMHLPQAQMPEDTPFPQHDLLDKVVAKLAKDHDITL